MDPVLQQLNADLQAGVAAEALAALAVQNAQAAFDGAEQALSAADDAFESASSIVALRAAALGAYITQGGGGMMKPHEAKK